VKRRFWFRPCAASLAACLLAGSACAAASAQSAAQAAAIQSAANAVLVQQAVQQALLVQRDSVQAAAASQQAAMQGDIGGALGRQYTAIANVLLEQRLQLIEQEMNGLYGPAKPARKPDTKSSRSP
jgi:hypothetical protein